MRVSKRLLLIGTTAFLAVGFGLLTSSKTYAAVSARNGASVLGGYVELGGTLRRNTSLMQGNNYKIGIGTRTPQNMLHLNSGTCNVAMRIQSTDPYALISFQDNLVSDVNSLPYVGGTGDEVVIGLGATNFATFRQWGVLGMNKLSKTYLNTIKARKPSVSIYDGELLVDVVTSTVVSAGYVDAYGGVWIWGNEGLGSMNLDPNDELTNYVYNDLDYTDSVPPAGDCTAYENDSHTGRMMYEKTNHRIWVCDSGVWRYIDTSVLP